MRIVHHRKPSLSALLGITAHRKLGVEACVPHGAIFAWGAI